MVENEAPLSRREVYRRFFLIVFMGVLASYVGLSFGYPKVFTPEKDYRTFSNIARDGWIENGARLSFARLFQRGNYVDVKLKSWRPAGQPPADLSFSLCGHEINRHTVSSNETIRLHLTGDCEPREIAITVHNPFVASASDTRELGAQLEQVTIGSRLYSPIISPQYFFLVSPFLIVVMLLVMGLVPARVALLSASLVSVAGIGLLLANHIAPIEKLFFLWVVVTVSLFGVHLAKGKKDDASSELAWHLEMPQLVHWLMLLGVLGIAGYLRFVDLSFGLPMNYHPDEVPKVNAIMRMYSTGTLNPQYFLHPTLLLYCTYATNTLFHWTGLFDGEFQNSLVIAGRTVSATAGLLTVFLAYQVGRLLFSVRVGLLAAGLLAVFPLHVTCSRYLKEDALLTFFVVLSFLCVVLAYRTKKPVWLIASGLFAGCSASVKYSGLISAGIPCLGAMVLEERWIPVRKNTYLFLLVALLLVPVAFVTCSPYVVLDHATFVKDFAVEQSHMEKGHFFMITPWSQYWTYHVERSLFHGITSPAFFLTFIAIGFLSWRARLPGLMVIALMLAFYFPAEYVKAKPAPQPERYILPCLPFIALAIASFVDAFMKRRRAFFIAACVVLLSPAMRSFELHRDLVPDTRLQMARWMGEHLPQRANVYIDHKRYSPELDEERFQVTYAPRGAAHRDLDLEMLSKDGYEYLLLSSLWYDRYFSQPRTDEAAKRKIEKVFREGKVLKRFESPSGTYGFHNPVVTLFDLRSKPLPSSKEAAPGKT